MSWKKVKLTELNHNLDNLKSLFTCKRLYLAEYFHELRNQIDLKVNKIIELNETNREEISKKWLQIIEFINSYEMHCFKTCSNNKFSDEITLQVNRAIELIEFKINNSNIDLDDETFELITDQIDDYIYENVLKLERIIFLNKTIFYLESTDIEPSFGKLIFVTNDHFGTKGTQFLINKFCQNIEIYKKNTNEITKSVYLSTIMRQFLTEKLIDEFEIDYNNLTEVNLHNSHLESIEPGVFDTLNNLTIVNLSWNRLAHLNYDIFSNLNKLSFLDLSGNKFTRFETNLFKGLTNLTCLWFQNNQIEQLDENLFNGLVSLTHIYMSSNRITELRPNLFAGLNNLTEIVMCNNKWNYNNKLNLRLEQSVKFISFKRFWDENNINDIIEVNQ